MTSERHFHRPARAMRRRLVGVLFVVGFGAAAALVPTLASRAPLEVLEEGFSYRETLVEFPVRSDSWSLAYDKGTVDHQAIAHRLDGAARGLASADVVILGTSRAGVGFHHETLAAFFEGHGLTFFNLALGHGEGFGFEMLLLRRYGASPGLIVANDDGSFLRRPFSEMGEQTLAMTRFDAAKYVLEKNLSWRVRRLLHGAFPLYASSASSQWIVFRHRDFGSWWLRTVVPELEELEEPQTRRRQPVEIANAAELQRQVRSLGAELVLSRVPTGSVSRGTVRELARRLGVRAITPDVRPARTTDGSHLDQESARRFTEAFVRELERTPSFERLFEQRRR